METQGRSRRKIDGNKRFVTDARIGRTIEARQKNRIPAVYAPTKEEAVQLVKSLMNWGDTISCGGSVTLAESGVRELMQSGEYTFLDWEAMPPEEAYSLKQFDFPQTYSSPVPTRLLRMGSFTMGRQRQPGCRFDLRPEKVTVVAGRNKIVRIFRKRWNG